MKEKNITDMDKCRYIENRIAELCVMADNITDDGFNIAVIGDEWLSLCGELFDDNSGYEMDEKGAYYFVPSSMKYQAYTDILSKLLRIADILDTYEETIGYTCGKDYKLSILTHLNRKACEGDRIANTILRERIRKRL